MIHADYTAIYKVGAFLFAQEFVMYIAWVVCVMAKISDDNNNSSNHSLVVIIMFTSAYGTGIGLKRV